MTIDSETIALSNHCQIEEVEKLCDSLDPNNQESCEVFNQQVQSIDALIKHTYRLTAFAAVREKSPENAAALWGEYKKLCEKAIGVLKNAKAKFPNCGAGWIYNTSLDYWKFASERHNQNQRDAECLKM